MLSPTLCDSSFFLRWPRSQLYNTGKLDDMMMMMMMIMMMMMMIDVRAFLIHFSQLLRKLYART